MDLNQGANGSDSPSGNTGGNPSDEGKIPQNKSPEQYISELKAENSRKSEEARKKTEETETLRQENEQLKQDRLRELQEKRAPSRSEQDEAAVLEAEIAQIQSDRRAKPWLQANERISKSTTDKALAEREMTIAVHRLKKLAAKEGITYDVLEKSIVQHLRNVDAGLPLDIRVEEAYELHLKQKEIDKKLKIADELAEKKVEAPFSDNGRNAPLKSQSGEEILATVRKNEGELAKALSAISAKQAQEIR